MIRDKALAASGLLVGKLGGPPVKPYQPAGLWEEKANIAYARDVRATGIASPQPLHLLEADLAAAGHAHLRRDQPRGLRGQAAAHGHPAPGLVLLNDPQYVEAARAWPSGPSTKAGHTLADRATFIVRSLTGRRPGERELAALTEPVPRAVRRIPLAAGPTPSKLLAVGDAPRDPAIDPAECGADRAGPGGAELRRDGDEAIMAFGKTHEGERKTQSAKTQKDQTSEVDLCRSFSCERSSFTQLLMRCMTSHGSMSMIPDCNLNRRHFFSRTSLGLGSMALASLLGEGGRAGAGGCLAAGRPGDRPGVPGRALRRLTSRPRRSGSSTCS